MIQNRRLKILVSAEVLEEVEEILSLLNGVDAEIAVAAPISVLEKLPAELIAPHRAVPVRDAQHGDAKAKLLGIGEFLRVARAARPDALISGFSMLKHRLAAWLLRTPHIAYIRGLMFNAEIRSGFSDRIEQNPLASLVPRRVRQPFGADRLLTVSEINRDFLEARGIPRDRIELCGPVWLSGVSPAPSGERRIIICTSAMAAHGHVDSHERQVESLARTVRGLASSDRTVILRVHPRDSYAYADDPRFASAAVDRQKTQSFLKSLTKDDTLVSLPSTLVFEAGLLGVPSLFYTLDDDLDLSGYLESTGAEIIELDDLGAALSREAAAVHTCFAPIDEGALRRALAELATARASSARSAR